MNILKLFFYFDPLFGIVFFLYSLTVFLIFLLFRKIQTIAVLKKNINFLNQTVLELDHLAQLIIKSDMELKLYQEEVEDKLNKLTLIKNLILSSIRILDIHQLFSQIDEKVINDLGFKKGLILDYASLEINLSLGMNPMETDALKAFLLHKKELFKTTPLLAADSEPCKSLFTSQSLKDFLIAPIRARENIHAIFVLASPLLPAPIKRAEKEIFAIICMYLGQCLDNIKLFEELYQSKDDLKKKIAERTNELVKSLREIEIISKKKSDFISSVSHELRTPLTSVKGFSSLLVEEKFGKLPEEAKHRLKQIDENVNKLVDMVNTLLDISRIESGKMEVKIAPADLTKLIKETSDFLSPQLQAKQINLAIQSPEPLFVYMDKHLIERVLINIINNAIKFSPKGGIITILLSTEKNHALISIADQGCGIEKDNVDKIFQEFFRVNNAINREVKGSGLGLALVRRIMDTHKENVWFHSEEGKGTTFYFTLALTENSAG